MRAAGGVQDENQHSWLMKLVFVGKIDSFSPFISSAISLES
jgi:hypothetical protein